MEENFIDWLNNDTFIKALATIKLYAEQADETDMPLTNIYLQYLAVCFCASEIVRQGKGIEVTDIKVARMMVFGEEDNE